MKKVLIIAYNFPPINNSASRRYGEMVSYMANFGWEAFVFTTNSKGDLKVDIPESNIIRAGEHYQKKLQVETPGAEWFPLFLRPGYILYKKLNLDFRSIDRFLISSTRLMLQELIRIKNINPDIILTSFSPATSLWIGSLLSRKIKKPWVADFRDPCSLSNNSVCKPIDKWIDRFLIKSSSGIVTVGHSWAHILSRFYGNKIAVSVYNGFKDAEIVGKKSNNGFIRRKEKIVYYAGVFYSNQLQSVQLLIKWLAYSKRDDVVFTIRSLGPKEMNATIRDYAKSLNVSKLVNILEPAEDEVTKKELWDADILMVFVDIKKDKAIDAGLITGKFLKLLPLEKPIVVIGREDSDIGKILNETKTGFLVSSFQQLDTAMKKIFSGSFRLLPAREEIKKYSSENQCKNLCAFLDQVIEKGRL